MPETSLPISCDGPPPTPGAICQAGAWFVPSIVVVDSSIITVNGTLDVIGDVVLRTNSTLEIITGLGADAATLNVGGCLDSANATLAVEFIEALEDTRYVPVINTGCMRGGFAEVRVKAPSKCQRYKGDSLFTGSQVAVLLQNDSSKCQSKSRKIMIAVIVVVAVLLAVAAAVGLYCYRCVLVTFCLILCVVLSLFCFVCLKMCLHLTFTMCREHEKKRRRQARKSPVTPGAYTPASPVAYTKMES